MTVVLNAPALALLLESPTGPVFRDIERRGEAARVALQRRIDSIISHEAVKPQAGLRVTAEGVVVGIEDHGSVAQYMDIKLGVKEPWWEPYGRPAASAI